MKKVLHLISSIQGNNSYSIQLGNAIVEKIQEKYPDSTVQEVNLTQLEIPHLNSDTLKSFFTPEDQLNAEGQELVRYSNEAVKQLLDADIIVIGAPLYNFTIPTTLQNWINHITRAGVTFGYGENGPIGMVAGKKVYVAMSSGGVYSEGPGKANDFVSPYLKAFLGLLGMTDVDIFRAEGVKVPGIQDSALQKGIESIEIH